MLHKNTIWVVGNQVIRVIVASGEVIVLVGLFPETVRSLVGTLLAVTSSHQTGPL